MGARGGTRGAAAPASQAAPSAAAQLCHGVCSATHEGGRCCRERTKVLLSQVLGFRIVRHQRSEAAASGFRPASARSEPPPPPARRRSPQARGLPCCCCRTALRSDRGVQASSALPPTAGSSCLDPHALPAPGPLQSGNALVATMRGGTAALAGAAAAPRRAGRERRSLPTQDGAPPATRLARVLRLQGASRVVGPAAPRCGEPHAGRTAPLSWLIERGRAPPPAPHLVCRRGPHPRPAPGRRAPRLPGAPPRAAHLRWRSSRRSSLRS